jgi:hypothetical protein
VVVGLVGFFALIGVLVSAAGTYAAYRFRTCVPQLRHEKLSDISGYDFEIDETGCVLTFLPGSLIDVKIYRHGDNNWMILTSYFPERGDPLPSFNVSDDRIIVSAPNMPGDFKLNYFDGKVIEYRIGKPAAP